MTRGAVVWMTGPPASGKSTLAQRLRRRLDQRAIPSILLDGDEIRQTLVPAPGYSPAERAQFYETLARLASLLAHQGHVVLVAATAHQRAHRDRARALGPRLAEVYLTTTPEECARRDPKKLYAAAKAGGLPELPGAGVMYEPPPHPDVVAAGGEDDEAIDRVIQWLEGS